MENKKAFSLVEILVVLGIAVVLLAISLPSFLGQSKALNLRSSADQLKGELLLARQQAATMNSVVEFRFFQENTESDFTAYQGFQVNDDGSKTPYSKIQMLPENVVIAREEGLSPLLATSIHEGVQSGSGPAVEGWKYKAVIFRSTGELVDVANGQAFLTLIDAQKPRTPPDNYATLTLQPLTGMVQVTQP